MAREGPKGRRGASMFFPLFQRCFQFPSCFAAAAAAVEKDDDARSLSPFVAPPSALLGPFWTPPRRWDSPMGSARGLLGGVGHEGGGRAPRCDRRSQVKKKGREGGGGGGSSAEGERERQMLLSLTSTKKNYDFSRRVIFRAVLVACLPPRTSGVPPST